MWTERLRFIGACVSVTRTSGFVLQSYLYRSDADLAAMLPLAPNVRIVKGAYLEPPDLAYPRKRDVDENYSSSPSLRSRTTATRRSPRTIPQIIDRSMRFAAARGIAKARAVRVSNALRHRHAARAQRLSNAAIACASPYRTANIGFHT